MKDAGRRTESLARLLILESRKRINCIVSIYIKTFKSAFIAIIRIASSTQLANVLFHD